MSDPFRALPDLGQALADRAERARPRMAFVAQVAAHMVRVRYPEEASGETWVPATVSGLHAGVAGTVLADPSGRPALFVPSGWAATAGAAGHKAAYESTTEIAANVQYFSTPLALPAGTWAYTLDTSAILHRSVNSGAYTLVGAIYDAAGVLAREHWQDTDTTMATLSSQLNVRHVASGTLTVAADATYSLRILYRGLSTAGTTYIRHGSIRADFRR